MERVTVYRSWTCVVELADIQALAPGKDMEPLVSDIGGVLVETFNRSLVGYTWDPEERRLLVTLKTKEQADALALTWEALAEKIVPRS